MALTEFEHALAEVKIAEYIKERRPPEELRKEVDLGFRVEDQSIVIFEIRPLYQDPGTQYELFVAKTTFVKKTGKWKVFWQRANFKWHRYDPHPEVDTLEEFIHVVEEDAYGCFWG